MARPIPNPQDWVRPPQVDRWWFNSPQRELWKVAIDLRRIPWFHLDKTENNVSPGLHTSSLEAALKLAQWLSPQSPLPLPNAPATGGHWGYLQRHNIKVAQQPLPMLRSRIKNVEKTTIPCLREVSDQKFAEYEQRYGPGINNEDLIHRARGTKYIYFHGQLPVGGALVKPGVNSVTEKVGYYYGGPIVDISTGEWRRAHTTDNARDLITLGPLLPAVPDDLSLIVQATAVMSSKYMTQSALKVGHRVLLSTLNFHHWLSDTPSAGEVQMVCDKFETFHVESDVDSTPPSSRSVKAGLVAYSIENDLGIFKLLNHFEPHQHSVPLDRLLEREGPDWKEILQPRREVACIAYNAGTEDGFGEQIQHYANSILREHWEIPFKSMNFKVVAKPTTRTFAPGTLDKADAYNQRVTFGVSCSVWKGSSGGPCVVMDGDAAGGIMGLVRGHEVVEGPYNAVNGFPIGLKNIIKHIDYRY